MQLLEWLTNSSDLFRLKTFGLILSISWKTMHIKDIDLKSEIEKYK